MKSSVAAPVPQFHPYLNAVALQNAVLCADCDVVSDSPHDYCMICGSRSLLNISGILGGSLHNREATLARLTSRIAS
jgi:hypothetical protein